uniref:Activating signal cointegrator 1 n=1 Tax=Anthurium amnicola TaxID=1678845 RepID=A0A1D1ZJU2_9ARAE
MGSSGEWLEQALQDLVGKVETGLQLDADVVSGLVSYCELAPPEDAREYLINIIGQEASEDVVQEYLHRRGYVDPSTNLSNVQPSRVQAYIKPPAHEGSSTGTKKQMKIPKERTVSSVPSSKAQSEYSDIQSIPRGSNGSNNNPKKKRTGKVISLAEASKGSIIFKQGKPCSCQARRHNLVSNCLSCGKIVCEQEGEGPCSFCGSLVLREGSTYAGLEGTMIPLSDAEVTAEAFAKRLVDYDRNAAARTTVIDDQSDYYELEGNSWLSKEEKDNLNQKLKEKEKEEEERRKKKVVMTFDLVGRKVLVNEDEASELKSEHRILRPLENRESNRIRPNPTARLQPIFVDTSSVSKSEKGKQRARLSKGLCLEISGRVQHDSSELQGTVVDGLKDGGPSDRISWERPSFRNNSRVQEDSYECSLDYN